MQAQRRTLWYDRNHEPIAEYLNTGDMYAATLIYRYDLRKFQVTCVGDLIEMFERQGYQLQGLKESAMSTPRPTVIVPIIHMNGDRKHTLMDNLHNAYDALRHAERMLWPVCSPWPKLLPG